MHMGSLNDPVKCYVSGKRIHAAILGAGMPLAFQKYWLFPIMALACFIFFIAFDKTIKQAWRESKKFQVTVCAEIAVSWVFLFAVAWLPTGGVKEGAVLLMLFPILWAGFRTNKELQRVIIGENWLKSSVMSKRNASE